MPLLAAVQIACLVVVAVLLVAAAWQDVRSLCIDDRLSLGIIANYALWAASGVVLGSIAWAAIGMALACALGVFGLGAVAFATGRLGGGDVKLAAATSLFAGPALLLDFALVAAILGGLMGVAMLAGAPIGPTPAGDGTVRSRLKRSQPYGPAIALAGLWVVATLAGF